MAESSRELLFLTRRVYAAADFALANSRNTARMLETLGVPTERIVTVYPGVDSNRFAPDLGDAGLRQRFATPDEVLLLSVGRLQRRKGHDLAIQAVAALRHDLPLLRYVIVGDGTERPYLERMVREYGVGDRVTFAGEVSDDDLPKLYAACDIFLLPNRIELGDIEGFGIVFLEAASAAKPVIAGNTGGVPEAVADGLTGLLVSGTDVQELVSTVRQLVLDPALRARLGRAGRKRVLQSFTWDRAAETVRRLHERAIEGSRN